LDDTPIAKRTISKTVPKVLSALRMSSNFARFILEVIAVNYIARPSAIVTSDGNKPRHNFVRREKKPVTLGDR
jgi:hypothetical protein